MHRLLLCLVVALSGCSRAPTNVGVVGHLNSTSALVSVEGGHGTGFVVSDHYVVTAFHVAGVVGSTVTVNFDDGAHYKGVVVAESKPFDISVVHLNGIRLEHVRLRVEIPAKGEELHWVGNPFGFYFLASKGSVSGYSIGDPRGGSIGTLILDAKVLPGYSGSGIGDSDGRIVGMVHSVFFTKKYGIVPIGFAVPSDRIAWVLRHNHIPYHE